MEPLVNKIFKNKEYTTKEAVAFLVKLFLEKIEPLLVKWATELSDALNCKENRLVFKLEKIASSVIMGAKKKRYVMGMDYKEGTFYDDPKLLITGFEAIRSTYKKQWRDWLKETYKIALYKTIEDVQEKVLEVEGVFRSMAIHDIATVILLSDLEKYSNENGTAIKGATKQAKAALNYNKLKKIHKLNGLDIQSGDKLLYVNLVKNNPFGIDVIGFPEYLPEEFGLDKYIDYNSIFSKNFLDPLTNFLVAIGETPKKQASAMSLFD